MPAQIGTTVTGNTKYDVTPTLQSSHEVVDLKHRLFPDFTDRTKIVVLGSIRPGEEDLWFEAFAAKWSKGDDIRVVVAPRHAAKYEYFADAISKLKVSSGKWSDLDATTVGRRMVLVDTMGVLRNLYGVADLAFIGATLVNVGGHNPLEAAMYGCPVCVGALHQCGARYLRRSPETQCVYFL